MGFQTSSYSTEMEVHSSYIQMIYEFHPLHHKVYLSSEVFHTWYTCLEHFVCDLQYGSYYNHGNDTLCQTLCHADDVILKVITTHLKYQ